jgi:integrase
LPAIDAALGEINTRLKAGGHRVRIERRHATLVLRATLPERGDPRQRRQQRIALGDSAAFESLHRAERAALELSHQLRQGEFSWAAWDARPESELTVEGFRTATRRVFESRPRSAASWGTKWQPALNKLPPSGALTGADLERVVRRMPENSAGRQVTGSIYAMVLDALQMSSAGVRKAASGYSRSAVRRREVPSEAEIEDLMDRLGPPHWYWTVGVVATFGLRPHEVADCVVHPDGTCEIGDNTKTGHRIAWANPERWFEKFKLGAEQHRPKQEKRRIYKSCNQYLRSVGSPIKLYDLRHAYAIRLLMKGVPPELGSRLMGHSMAVHTQTYQRWVRAQNLALLRERYVL